MLGGAVLDRLLAEIRAEAAGERELMILVEACAAAAAHLASAGTDDRLAGSYPFLTMLSVAVAGWLMARQIEAAEASDADPDFLAMKRAAARFYLDQIVPEATGLKAAATASSDILYSIPEGAFAA